MFFSALFAVGIPRCRERAQGGSGRVLSLIDGRSVLVYSCAELTDSVFLAAPPTSSLRRSQLNTSGCFCIPPRDKQLVL